MTTVPHVADRQRPVRDEHILGAISLVVLAAFRAGDTSGLGRLWAALPLVRKEPVLR